MCPILLSIATMPAMNTQVDRFLASLPPLKAYGPLGRQHAQDRPALTQRICVALLVDDTIKMMETPGGIFPRVASILEDRALQCAIGVWKWVRRLRLSIRQPYKLPRDCTREDLDHARAAFTPYSTLAWVLTEEEGGGGNNGVQ